MKVLKFLAQAAVSRCFRRDWPHLAADLSLLKRASPVGGKPSAKNPSSELVVALKTRGNCFTWFRKENVVGRFSGDLAQLAFLLL